MSCKNCDFEKKKFSVYMGGDKYCEEWERIFKKKRSLVQEISETWKGSIYCDVGKL